MQVKEVSRPDATPRWFPAAQRPYQAIGRIALRRSMEYRLYLERRSALKRKPKVKQPELRITMKRPRHRFFPAEVQWGNGGAKILVAEKLGKAVR